MSVPNPIIPLEPMRGAVNKTSELLEWRDHDSHSEITYTEFGPYMVEKVGDDDYWAWAPDETKNARIVVQGLASRDDARAHCQQNLDGRRAATSSARTITALREAERFMAYFAGETDGMFVGPGTPESCLGVIRTALATPAPEPQPEVAAETAESINAWIDQTFGLAASAISIATRANQEMSELIMGLSVNDNDPSAPEEAADIVIVLHRLCARFGTTLAAEVDRKMKINRARKWNVANGHGYHVKDATPPVVEEAVKAENDRLREALAYARKGLDMVHNGLMDPSRPRQAVGEVCAHFLKAATDARSATP